MFDIGWSELLLIGVVALIVVGPKDLPHLFRALGRFTAKARAMAREFSSAMEEASRNSGMDDAANSLRDLKSLTSKKSLGLDALDRAADRFEKWDPARPVTGNARSTQKPAANPAAQPDPSAPVAPAAPIAADTATPPAATEPVAPSGMTAQPPAEAEAETGPARRLHAVRRSDMKDR